LGRCWGKAKGAVVVNALLGTMLTGIAYGAGWVPIPPLPTPDAYADPFTWAGAWLVTAGGVLALAQLLHVAVYGRVFRAGTTQQTTDHTAPRPEGGPDGSPSGSICRASVPWIVPWNGCVSVALHAAVSSPKARCDGLVRPAWMG